MTCSRLSMADTRMMADDLSPSGVRMTAPLRSLSIGRNRRRMLGVLSSYHMDRWGLSLRTVFPRPRAHQAHGVVATVFPFESEKVIGFQHVQ